MILAVAALVGALEAPVAWPGPYAGARIIGGGDVCAVYTEDPVRSTAEERGIVHYYVAGYAEDYVSALHPSFGIGGAWEDARGATDRPRPPANIEIGGGEIEATAAFRSILDPDLHISYRVFPTRAGAIVFEIEIRNAGAAPKEVVVRPVLRFRGTPDSLEAWSDGKGTATAAFPLARLDLRFVGDRNVHAVRAAPGDFPAAEVPVTVSPGAAARAAFALVGTAAGSPAPPPGDGDLTFDAARAAWGTWFRSGDEPPPATPAPLRSAFRAALAATAAVNLRGAVPADVTGQFVTNDRPQLYPRDALMTARALMEAGHVEEAAAIVRFWGPRIPQKSPGEWYARYDARAGATPGGSGAAYDVPEWDSNGYYASMLLALYMRTGRWEGDFDLMKALLDFVVERQGLDGLVEEGGIVEWPGRLPATNMTVAAGLRHGALVCEIRGDPVSARRYRAAAWKMERGLARLLDPARGAYVDSRPVATGFDASANFGFVWGFPDHLGLALTNAWYRRHAVRLGGGVQYFEAEGYGDDLFGFTTAAAARYHAEAGDPEAYAEHVRWMAERTNRYGLFPERIHFPGGADVSEASPLSWCGAEFAAALLAGARVADAAAGADRSYALASLVSAVEGLGRVVAALPPEPPIARIEALSRRIGIVGREDRPWEERLRVVRAALDEMREVGGPEATGEALDDVRPMVERLLLVADRIVRNAAGVDVRLRLDTPAVASGVEARLNVAVETAPDVAWRAFAVEHLDGNAAWRRRAYPIPADALPTNIPVLFERPGPYEGAIRVTARGEWKGIPFGLARTVPLDVLERFAVSTAEETGRLVATVRVNVEAADLSVECPAGWRPERLRDAAGAAAGAARFALTPFPDVPPGRYAFALVAGAERRPFEADWRTTVPLEGRWRFRTGDDPSWAAPDAPADGGEEIDVPIAWENAGRPGYDGIAWYRIDAIVPEAWRGRDVAVVMGAVDDEDVTYWNGVEVGRSNVWNAPRRYVVPAADVRYGAKNTLAVRVVDHMYGGGIWKGPVRLEIVPE